MTLEEAIGVIIEMDQSNHLQTIHVPIEDEHRYFDAMRTLMIWYYEKGEHRHAEGSRGQAEERSQ